MVILAATGKGYFSRHMAISVALCFFCFVVQIVSLAFAVQEQLSGGAGLICCTRLLDHPVNVSDTVRVGQWFALVFAVMFPCERI
jgi:hypothetical protein